MGIEEVMQKVVELLETQEYKEAQKVINEYLSDTPIDTGLDEPRMKACIMRYGLESFSGAVVNDSRDCVIKD